MSLSTELLLEITSYLDNSAYYSFHCACTRSFSILSDTNLRKVRIAESVAKKELADFKLKAREHLSSEVRAEDKERYERHYYFNALYGLTWGTPYENVLINVKILERIDVERLVTFYRDKFHYKLKYIPRNEIERGCNIILSYRFLIPFYKKHGTNYEIILFALKELAYNAPVTFKSVHELRSIEKEENNLEEDLFLKNYVGNNASFPSQFESLRGYPSEFEIRIKRTTF